MAKYLGIGVDEEEIRALLKFVEKEMKKGDKCTFLSLKELKKNREIGKGFVLKEHGDYLSEAEVRKANIRAVHFMRNWYKFDAQFEKSLVFEGISLGLLSVSGMMLFFENSLQYLKAVSNAIRVEQPDIVFAGKDSVSGKVAKAIAKKAPNAEIRFFDTSHNLGWRMWPNFSKRKLLEINDARKRILSRQLRPGAKKGKHLVFVRSRGFYLAGVEEALRAEKDFSIYSLDEFLLKRVLNPTAFLRFLRMRKKLPAGFLEMLEGYESSKGFSRGMVFEGMPLKELFDAHIQRFARRTWPEFVFVIKEFEKLFSKKRPKAVVLWSDYVAFERICAIIARRQGIPSLVVQHGMFGSDEVNKDWIGGFVPLTANKIAVWGPRDKRDIVKRGVSGSRVLVTGAPRMDPMHKMCFDREKFRKRIGLKPDEKMILLAPPPSKFKYWTMLETTLEAMKRFPGYRLVVKVHPCVEKEDYLEISGKQSKGIIVLKDVGLHKLIDISSAVITYDSSLAVEALALGKPVILIKNIDPWYLYDSTDAVFKTHTPKELEEALEMALKKENREMRERTQNFVYDCLFKQDGKAGQRVVEAVKQMISEKAAGKPGRG